MEEMYSRKREEKRLNKREEKKGKKIKKGTKHLQ